LGYAISRQSYLVKASARGPQKTAPWPPRGARALFEKPCPRKTANDPPPRGRNSQVENHWFKICETVLLRVWLLTQSCLRWNNKGH